MVVAGITDHESYIAAREPLIKMGIYFQAQDDYLDCFGTPEQIGKIGTDIQDKKCGWLFVNAYNGMVDAKDKQYGQPTCKVGSKPEKAIKEIYKKIGLEAKYQQYEEDSYAEIMSLKGSCSQVPWAVFETF